MDLINGKTMYCPECGQPLTEYDGKINNRTAHVKARCENCDKNYHWVAYMASDTEHKVIMFSGYLRYDHIKAEF